MNTAQMLSFSLKLQTVFLFARVPKESADGYMHPSPAQRLLGPWS